MIENNAVDIDKQIRKRAVINFNINDELSLLPIIYLLQDKDLIVIQILFSIAQIKALHLLLLILSKLQKVTNYFFILNFRFRLKNHTVENV